MSNFQSIQNLGDVILGKGRGRTLMAIVTTVAATWWLYGTLIDVKDEISGSFRAQEKMFRSEMQQSRDEINHRIDTVSLRLDKLERQAGDAWTIQMQALRSSYLARYNTNGWFPNDYDIFWSVKDNKPIPPTRISQ